MILGRTGARQPTRQWQVSLPMGEPTTITADTVVTDGGALVFTKASGDLVVAFGPGAWLEVQPAS